MTETKNPSRRVVYAALAGNLLIALSKFIAAFISGSSAILSEGFHSLVDAGDQVLLLHGLNRARLPADQAFPFGHGKEIYFWSFVVAIIIFAIGAGVSFYEGVHHLLHPAAVKDFAVNYIVLGIAGLFEGLSWLVSFFEFPKVKGPRAFFRAVRASKDPAVFVVLFEDSAAVLGILAAFAGIFISQVTGSPYSDGAASLMIGLILGTTSIFLAYETKGLLIGESANAEVLAGIRSIASGTPYVESINEILTMHVGPDFILVNISVDFEDRASSAEIEDSVEAIDKKIKQNFPDVKKVFIEAESRYGTRKRAGP